MSETDPIFPISQSRVTRRRGETISIAERIDRAADALERAWRGGKRPRLEDYLGDFADFEHSALLFELVLLEATCRQELGESVSVEEYVDRFPQHEAAVRMALAEAIGTAGGPEKAARPEAVAADVEIDAQATMPLQRNDRPHSEVETAYTSSRYIDITPHDSGGMGDVFRSHDIELGRNVAIKAVQKRLINNPAVRHQFDVEVKVTSRLDHPGIVPVYGMGQFSDGRFFFVMRFIEGMNFRTAIKDFHATDWKHRPKSEYRRELNRLLGHFVAACHTMAYAHNRGIVHRDIKPQNIMLGRFQETLVVDWGLAVPVQRDERARASGEKTVMPQVGDGNSSSSASTAGTLGYMSPEQFQDADAPLGPASDIYSLGATLYHLLTGEAPHQGSSLTETSKLIRTGDFPPPSKLNKAIPKALEAICLKAMALRPNDRYASATELARDVTSWMTGERVSVYREPFVERILRMAQQHSNWTATLGVACALLFGAAVLSSIWMTQAARSEAVMREQADQLRDESLRQSAMFAAQTIEANIDRRWRILSYYAQDTELGKLVLACKDQEKGSPALKAMQDWLNAAFLEAQFGESDTTWLISEANGRQLARVPPDTSVGGNFAHRDYFHGQGLDKPPEEGAGQKPITRPHLSNVFLSAVRGSGYRVAFSVPVYKNGRPTAGEEPIGVLAMTVKTGAFQVLRNAVLIDLREDRIDKEVQRGLVLHHEDLMSLAEKATVTAPPRLSKERFEQLVDAKNRLLASMRDGRGLAANHVMAELLPNYTDPLNPEEKGIAAFAPVIVRREGAGNEPFVPWIVIVPQEVNQEVSTSRK